MPTIELSAKEKSEIIGIYENKISILSERIEFDALYKEATLACMDPLFLRASASWMSNVSYPIPVEVLNTDTDKWVADDPDRFLLITTSDRLNVCASCKEVCTVHDGFCEYCTAPMRSDPYIEDVYTLYDMNTQDFVRGRDQQSLIFHDESDFADFVDDEASLTEVAASYVKFNERTFPWKWEFVYTIHDKIENHLLLAAGFKIATYTGNSGEPLRLIGLDLASDYDVQRAWATLYVLVHHSLGYGVACTSQKNNSLSYNVKVVL